MSYSSNSRFSVLPISHNTPRGNSKSNGEVPRLGDHLADDDTATVRSHMHKSMLSSSSTKTRSTDNDMYRTWSRCAPDRLLGDRSGLTWLMQNAIS